MRYEGPGRSGQSAMKLATLTINGAVVGTSNRTDMKFETTGNIVVGPGGSIGGSPAGTTQSHEVSLVSTNGTVTIDGRVEADRKPARVEGRNGVSISGVVNSRGGSTHVGSTAGPVALTGNARVTGDGNVTLDAGPRQPVTIDCAVVSRRGNVVINGRRTARPPGNVTVADTVIAAREVIIYADTLTVSGLIKGNTVQKHCKVVIIRPGGRIEGKGSEKDKVAQKQEAKERPPSPPAPPAQQANVVRVTGDPGAVVDLRAAPGAVQAAGSIAVLTGPGGTIDLRGNAPMQWVFVCPGPIELAADEILTDPGVPVETLGGPGPVLRQPGRAVVDVGAHCREMGEAYPGLPLRVQFAVTNLGNVPEAFEFTLGDSLGWGPVLGPMSAPLGTEDADCETLITLDPPIPPWAIPDVDTNKWWIRARPLSAPWDEYEEEFRVPVRSRDELRDVSATPWQTTTPAPGAPAHVDWWLMNIGSLPDDYEVTVHDSLGWGFTPPHSVTPLGPGGDTILRVSALIPPWSFLGQVNRVWIETRSLQAPDLVRRDWVTITVGEVTDVAGPPDGEVPRGDSPIAHSCRPNPFNPSVEIRFTMPSPGGEAEVAVYDARGRRVRRLLSGACEPGERSVRWDGRDDQGQRVAGGAYVYRIVAGGRTALGKVVMSK